jgi:hypothetical protein
MRAIRADVFGDAARDCAPGGAQLAGGESLAVGLKLQQGAPPSVPALYYQVRATGQ